ncbi:hypothetical protein J6P59_03440 [bacterium]|nr:hypothetical protein [bacterium]
MSYSKQDVINELRKAKNLTELVEIKNKLLKTLINPLQKELASTKDVQTKKNLGFEMNQIKKALNDDFLMIKDEFDYKNNNLQYFIKDNKNTLYYGQEHILEKINNQILDIFKQLGFDIKSGNDIVSTY